MFGACASYLGYEDEYTSRVDPDASVDGSDSADPDSRVDGSDSADLDASADGGDSAETSSPDADGGLEGEASSVFCTTQHTFCDDFDSVPLSQNWTEIITTAGPAELSTVNSFSAPNSFFAKINANAADYSTVGVYKMFSTAENFHVELELLVAAKSQTGGVDIVSLDFNPPSGYQKYGVAFGISNGTYQLRHWTTDSGGVDATSHADLSGSTSFAVWRKVEIDVALMTTGGTAKLKLDGQFAVELPLAGAPPLGARLNLGGSFLSDIDKIWQIYADNVIVDAN